VTLTFVVGSGRCGSTMLSRILHRHPDVLSVSEFFAMLMRIKGGRTVPTADMDGRRLWAMLSKPDAVYDAMIQAGIPFPELCYPHRSGRFDLATGIPTISHMTLPMLSDDPDALYDLLAAEVPSWPERTAADQYRALFDHLRGVLGRRVTVERSGASLSMVPMLHEQFPEARFVHIHRGGPDSALSMSRHPGFRMAGLVAAAKRAAGSATASWEELSTNPPAEFAGLLTAPFDAERYMSFPLPLTFFGELWSATVCAGVEALTRLPAGTWTSLAYEDLIADPASELARLAEFIGVVAPRTWLDLSGDLVDARRTGKARRLDPAELTALGAACRPGTEAIAAAESHRTGAGVGFGGRPLTAPRPSGLRGGTGSL
jgi:hypothetical protein